jgi:NADH-quinone oxidoreductase subunit M
MPKSPAGAARARRRRHHRRRAGAHVSLLASSDRDAGFQFRRSTLWIAQWGISWNLGVDGISLFLVVLTGCCSRWRSSAPTPPRRQAVPGVDPAPRGRADGLVPRLDLFLFFIFFEIVLVPMYFLIGGWGYADRVYAAIKFFLFTMTGSAFMLVGILATGLPLRAAERWAVDLRRGRHRAERQLRQHRPARWLFASFAVAFAVKVRSSRCTPGCPTPTPGARPRAPSSWPASC